MTPLSYIVWREGSEEPSQGLIGIVGIGLRAKVNVDYTGMFGERVFERIAKVAIAGDQDPIHLAGPGIVEGISLADEAQFSRVHGVVPATAQKLNG